MKQLVDIGANLTNKAFRSDLGEVLARAAAGGVRTIVVTGTSVEGSLAARRLVQDHGDRGVALYSTAGIHPHHASQSSRSDLAEIESLCARPEVVAVGECGLDFNRNFSPREDQLKSFEAQLAIAANLHKPLFLHERDAHEAFVEVLRRHRSRICGGVVHCFTGDRLALEAYLALDLYIGMTGWICDERRGTHLLELVRLIPTGRLLIETDAPYILPRDMPVQKGNRRNEPAFLPHIAAAIARARGETPEQLATHTTAAARELFGVGA